MPHYRRVVCDFTIRMCRGNADRYTLTCYPFSLGSVTTTRPRLLLKVLGYSLAMTPRWGPVKIIGTSMAGMAAHHAKP